MHDPEEYLNMNRLVAYLHEEKMRQEADPQKMLGIFGDYDTDGVCASALLSGSFAVFGFRYMTCIPTMDEGYGINQKGVDRMIALVEKQGYRLDMIITADNGIAAHDGIAYAAGRGITVVVTDHHPSGKNFRRVLPYVWIHGRKRMRIRLNTTPALPWHGRSCCSMPGHGNRKNCR